MINLSTKDLAIIEPILREKLTNLGKITIYAFGSRVNGTAQPFSDLDLVIVAKQIIPQTILNELKFKLSDSDLSIQIDILDWHCISKQFKQQLVRNWLLFMTIDN